MRWRRGRRGRKRRRSDGSVPGVRPSFGGTTTIFITTIITIIVSIIVIVAIVVIIVIINVVWEIRGRGRTNPAQKKEQGSQRR